MRKSISTKVVVPQMISHGFIPVAVMVTVGIGVAVAAAIAATVVIGVVTVVSAAPVLRLITVSVTLIIVIAVPFNDRLNPNGDGRYSERVSNVRCQLNAN